jgi:hypothetical protein
MLKFCNACGCETERCAHGKCKPCNKARGEAWRAANQARVKAAKRAYHADNREKINARSSAWYANNRERAKANAAARHALNPEKRKAMNAAWEALNRDKVNARHAAWDAANPEKRKAAYTEYYATHREECAKRAKAWADANPGVRRAHGQNRRAKIREAGGSLSPDIADRLLKLQRGKCACCGQPLKGKFDLDHIIPIAKGGPNVDSNIQLLLPKCNREKHTKHPVDFMQSRGLLL